MWWILIIGIICFLVFGFARDRKKLQTKIQNEGGMREKYNVLIYYLLQAPNAQIAQIASDRVEISGSSKYFVFHFTILQAFDNVAITWRSKGPTGELKEQWTFPSYFDQQQMALKINNDVEFKLNNYVDYDAIGRRVIEEAEELPFQSKSNLMDGSTRSEAMVSKYREHLESNWPAFEDAIVIEVVKGSNGKEISFTQTLGAFDTGWSDFYRNGVILKEALDNCEKFGVEQLVFIYKDIVIRKTIDELRKPHLFSFFEGA